MPGGKAGRESSSEPLAYSFVCHQMREQLADHRRKTCIRHRVKIHGPLVQLTSKLDEKRLSVGFEPFGDVGCDALMFAADPGVRRHRELLL